MTIAPALGAGAPLGFLVLRWLLDGAPLQAQWLSEELTAQWVTYLYLLVSTSVVFLSCAWVLGRSADALEAASRRDALTGLYNRGHMEEALERELERSLRFGFPVAFLLVDVDGLKRLNDVSGHEAGDAALQAVAGALERSRRSTDLAGRWGGDEFAIIAPGATAAAAKQLADRVRTELRNRPGPAGAPPTVSIGITDNDLAKSASPHALYVSADRALYEAKARGRDRAVVSERPPPEDDSASARLTTTTLAPPFSWRG